MPKPFESAGVTGDHSTQVTSQAAPNQPAAAFGAPDVRVSGMKAALEQDEESLLRHLRSRYDPAAMRLLKKLRKGPQA